MALFGRMKIQTFGRIGISILVATTVLVLGTTYLSIREVRSIDATWAAYNTRIAYKRDLHTSLQNDLGYRGPLHIVQKAIATQSAFDISLLQNKLQKIEDTLTLYGHTNPTEIETAALRQIQNMVDGHLFALNAVETNSERAATALAFDVTPALNALITLDKELTLMRENAVQQVSNATQKTQWIMASLGGSAAFLLGAIVSIFSGLFRWRIIEPLTQLSGTMETLAAGHYGIGIPFADQSDELGMMSRNIETFRDHALAREQAEKKWRHLAEELSIAKAETQATLARAEESEARYRHLAQHDDLTGLANRALFHYRLYEAIAVAKRTRLSGAILILDLDRFKDINDTLGHPAGDELLRQVGERLGQQARETDTVARLGGDEFAIIATHIDRIEGVGTVAEKIIAQFSKPFDLHGTPVNIGTSVGISTFPSPGYSDQEYLKHADIALYRAKSEGRGTWRHYNTTLDEEMHDKKNLERDLREAIAQDALEIHYQPQIDVKSGTLNGVECFVRWNHLTRGYVNPEDFITLSESSGLIHSLGEWILKAVCKQIKMWEGQGLPAIRFAVTMSAHQLKHYDFPNMLERTIEAQGLKADRLELEITEGTATRHNLDDVLNTLHTIKSKGVYISVDDFGSGYSALNRLKNLPIDKVKIDRCFTKTMCQNPYDAEVVRSIIRLAKSLGMTVVAEGIETVAQVDQLISEGCSVMQGDYFGQPVAPDPFYQSFLKTT